MKSYREVREELSQQTGVDTSMPCTLCSRPTKRETLNAYGARCFRCYELYCAERTPSPDVGDKRTGDPRSWAYALLHRQQNGERLSAVQQKMMRAVCKVP